MADYFAIFYLKKRNLQVQLSVLKYVHLKISVINDKFVIVAVFHS